MKSLHQTSDPHAPSVSAWPQNPPVRGTCRYCGCAARECLVPKGQYGYTTCCWMDDDDTVCSSPACTHQWVEEREGRAPARLLFLMHRGSQPMIVAGPLGLAELKTYRGIQARVARSLGVSRSAVARVVIGKTKSARISAALAEELALIDRQIHRSCLSGDGARNQETRSRQASCGANGQASHPGPDGRAVPPSSPKPRIVLRCMDAPTFEKAGIALATAPGCDAIKIGERTRAEAQG